jgi:hypothetical protein
VSPRRGLVGAFAAGVLVAAVPGVVVARSSGSPRILDTEMVERAIERSSLTQRGVRTRASCPAGVHQKKGLTFFCTAVTARGGTRFTVTEVDDAGRVHYEAR